MFYNLKMGDNFIPGWVKRDEEGSQFKALQGDRWRPRKVQLTRPHLILWTFLYYLGFGESVDLELSFHLKIWINIVYNGIGQINGS